MIAAILCCLLLSLPAQSGVQSLDAAMALYQHGKFQDAADILSVLIRKEPQNAAVHTEMGKVWLKLRRWDAAVQEFEKAVASEPKNGLNHLWLARACGHKAEHVFFLSALSWAKRTGKEFESAVQLSPDSVDARFDLLEFCAQAPGMVGGGKDKAEEQARVIARLSPRLGYTARANIFEDGKEWERARQELVEATVKFPNDAGGFVDLAEFLLKRRDPAGALANAQTALLLKDSNLRARLCRAAAQIELGSTPATALKVLRELVAGPLTDQDPPFEEVYYWLGRGYLALGQKPEARQALSTSLGFDPDYSPSKDALAQIKHLP